MSLRAQNEITLALILVSASQHTTHNNELSPRLRTAVGLLTMATMSGPVEPSE